ncbi:MAG TPA: hypothetical protein VN317_08650, partial [Candidatus Methanoperedens sp.]|nr:hypothetical protein [Candidatus Methanoperedens sp.]
MDTALEVLLRGSTSRLAACSRDLFRVGLSLVAEGDGCVCDLQPEGVARRDACRAFTASLFAASAPRVRCPEGFLVIVRT